MKWWKYIHFLPSYLESFLMHFNRLNHAMKEHSKCTRALFNTSSCRLMYACFLTNRLSVLFNDSLIKTFCSTWISIFEWISSKWFKWLPSTDVMMKTAWKHAEKEIPPRLTYSINKYNCCIKCYKYLACLCVKRYSCILSFFITLCIKRNESDLGQWTLFISPNQWVVSNYDLHVLHI